MTLFFEKVRVPGHTDPVNVRVEQGTVAEVGPQVAPPSGADVIHEPGAVLLPGAVDLHVHLRDPGHEYKEDLASGTRAAAKGGATTVVAMPDTAPVLDTADAVGSLVRRASAQGGVQVLPCAAVTVGLAGDALSPMAELKDAGAVAVGEAFRPVQNPTLLCNALRYAAEVGLPVFLASEEAQLSGDGVMHEGHLATALGLKGRPAAAEELAVARAVALARESGARVHLSQVSLARSVEMVAAAKDSGVSISAGVSVLHLLRTVEDVTLLRPELKVRPPLRDAADQRALIQGLAEGVLTSLTSGHAPQGVAETDVTFGDAGFGAATIESLVPAAMQVVDAHGVGLEVMARALSVGPCEVLGRAGGHVAAGAAADLVLVSAPGQEDAAAEPALTKGRNQALAGERFGRRVLGTWAGGECVYRRGEPEYTAEGVQRG